VAYDLSIVVGSLIILSNGGLTGVGFIFLPGIAVGPGVVAFLSHDILSNNKNITS
jgi:hypothetical protein